MSKIAPFVFNVLQARAVDPANSRFFLPTVLAGADGDNSDGKLLPLEADPWTVRDIQGDEGREITKILADQWLSYLDRQGQVDLDGQHVIGNPTEPWPSLTMGDEQTKMVVDGLENLFVEEGAHFETIPEGYRASITLAAGYWDGTDGRRQLPELTIRTNCSINQALCLADSGKAACSGKASTRIDGSGKAAVDVTQAFIDVVVAITATPDSANLTVVVESVKLRGPTPNKLPGINVTKLTFDTHVSTMLKAIWYRAATVCISSDKGQQAIVYNVNAELAKRRNLDALSAQLTRHMALVTNSVFKTTQRAAPGRPTGANPADQCLFDHVRYALNAPESPFFLPEVACHISEPSLSHLKIDRIDLPPMTIHSIPLTDGKLSNILVTGLNNIKADVSNIELGSDTLKFVGDLGGWTTPPKVSCSIPPPPITATAGFSIMTPDTADGPITGNLTLTINEAEIRGECSATGTSDEDAKITMTSLKILAADLTKNLHVELDINSPFKDAINNIINRPRHLQPILDGLNAQIEAHLGDISTQVTAALRTALAQELR